jgi:hypothetical protein
MTLNQRKQILEELELHEDRLSSWEWEFVRDIRTRLEEKPHATLSDKQEDLLEKIHARRTRDEDPSGFDHGDYAGW